MLNRVAFLLIAAFWVTMNVLLWRAEYGRHNDIGSAVPPQMVWQKMLTAPDNSSLVILHNGKNAGFGHWATEITEAAAARAGQPEDMVSLPTGYHISLEGNITLPELTNHLRFDFDFLLNRDHTWRQASVSLMMRRRSCSIRSKADERTVQLKVTGADGGFERDFTFAELENPQALVQEFAGPLPLNLPDSLDLPSGLSVTNAPASLGLTWEAHDAWLNFGHTPTRVYRLSARVLDRYSIVIFVSHVGEVVRADLPEGYAVVNDRLATP